MSCSGCRGSRPRSTTRAVPGSFDARPQRLRTTSGSVAARPKATPSARAHVTAAPGVGGRNNLAHAGVLRSLMPTRKTSSADDVVARKGGAEARRAPRYVPVDYQKVFSSPWAERKEGKDWWHKGTGTAPKEHPLADRVSFCGCAGCDSNDVLVIAARHVVHPYSGDAYCDYEVRCQACGLFTVSAYSDR